MRAREREQRLERESPGYFKRRSAKSYRENPDRAKASTDKWRKAHPESRRRSHRIARLRRYGLTLEAYDRLFARQRGLCAICQRRSRKRLHVDHCHDTGRVRGLLCSNCNTGIGMLGDSLLLLRAACAYLRGRRG